MQGKECYDLLSGKKEKNRSSCELCGGTGWVWGQEGYTPCQCVKEKKMHQLWEKSGLRVEDNEKTFSNFEEWNDNAKQLKNKAIDYYKQFNAIKDNRVNSIVLGGQVGSGKTHLILALANNFIQKRKINVIYLNYRDIIAKLKRNALDDNFISKELEKYQKAEILLIDDLFKGKVTDADVNFIFEIVNYRYNNYLPMMITTEYDVNGLCDIDEAVGSRLFEISKGFNHFSKGRHLNYRMK